MEGENPIQEHNSPNQRRNAGDSSDSLTSQNPGSSRIEDPAISLDLRNPELVESPVLDNPPSIVILAGGLTEEELPSLTCMKEERTNQDIEYGPPDVESGGGCGDKSNSEKKKEEEDNNNKHVEERVKDSIESCDKSESEDPAFQTPENEPNEETQNDSVAGRMGNPKSPKSPNSGDKAEDPVFDGTETLDINTNPELSSDDEGETQGRVWPEKAAALTQFVRDKGVITMNKVIRRLSGRKDDDVVITTEDPSLEKEVGERSLWTNTLSLMRMSNDHEELKNDEVPSRHGRYVEMKGRVLLYTKLGCEECKEVRAFLRRMGLQYVEINTDLYPRRKREIERISGSSSVPRVFFNATAIGGLRDLRDLEVSGDFEEKVSILINESPSPDSCPLPPLSGEDDESGSGAMDELALVVRKMRASIAIKDRFYKMRRFTACFLGSDAVDFLIGDQYLEREEAVEFAGKLMSKLFFTHVLDEDCFVDGNHPYRFLVDDPTVSLQCRNIPRGILEVKPKSISEISARLATLAAAIFDAYTFDGGKFVDYQSIHGSEEFARYLRMVEELQRVEMGGMSVEEKLSFFINIYNMMTIHAILEWGHPTGALERRRHLGDFKYVIGGCAYSLSSVLNGVLRANQRPPYTLIRPFGSRDKRAEVALDHPEPLVHFALVTGNRSSPSLQSYSPDNVRAELVDAACSFLRSDFGVSFDPLSKTVSMTKILKWYSVDFGKSENEVLRRVLSYMEREKAESLLELLEQGHPRVTYYAYDWCLNC